ncbi:hypothetical protein V8E55_009815 [Tylopilus felleus]
MADPVFEVRPDFASNAYRMVQEAVMAAHNIDVDEAINCITAAWQLEHNQRVEAWNLEQEANAREAERIQLEQRQRDEEERRLQEAETSPLPTWSPPGLPKGCLKASQNNRSQADDALGITTTHDVLTLRPVASVKGSCNAKADHELSFSDFLQAKNAFLKHLGQAAWPEKHVNALAKFFWNIENHPIHDNLNGNPIALHYASRIRRRWHDDLKNNSGKIFNVSLINENLMNSIAFEINSSIQNKVVQKVCFIPINHITTVNHLYPSPSSYSLRSITSHPDWCCGFVLTTFGSLFPWLTTVPL